MRKTSGIFLFVALMVVVGVYVQSIRRISIPQKKMLCQLKPGEQNISFVCPKGHHFNFVIGIPKSVGTSNMVVTGIMLVKTDTSLVAELFFNTQKCTGANWLDIENLDAFIITLPINDLPQKLDQQLKEGLLIDLHIEIDSSSQNTSSLWLTYLTHWADWKK